MFFRIGDVAEIVGVKTYVLRYWETEFPFIAPQKSASGQRIYRRSDVDTVLMIKGLLYGQKYSIEGARQRIQEMRKNGELKNYRERAGAKTASGPASIANTTAASSSAPARSAIDPAPAYEAMRRADILAALSELALVAAQPLETLFTA
jgi:DNA-binding transcriptional MerR regulator